MGLGGVVSQKEMGGGGDIERSERRESEENRQTEWTERARENRAR